MEDIKQDSLANNDIDTTNLESEIKTLEQTITDEIEPETQKDEDNIDTLEQTITDEIEPETQKDKDNEN